MRHALLIACVLLALCAGSARADWTATSTLTNFRVNLTDLALHDGLAPEPASFSLLLAGLMVLPLFRRRKR